MNSFKESIKKLVESYLGFFARMLYLKFRPFVIGITGSSGKTTVKYMISELMDLPESEMRVAPENMNTETGLPLAVLGFKKSPKNILDWLGFLIVVPFKGIFTFSFSKYLILEYAADKPNDISYLVDLAPPDIAVITNVGVAHLEVFKTVEKIAKEKWKLAQNAKTKVICSKEVKERAKIFGVPRAEVSVVGEAKTVKIENIKNLANKTEFDLILNGRKYKNLSYNFLGMHNLQNLELAVWVVVAVLGESEKALANISKLRPQQGRGRRFAARKGVLVIDESYNANPISMLSALKNLSQITLGRKVAILGEMKELGKITANSHREIAVFAKKIANLTVGVGSDFSNLGLDKWYPNVEELIKDVKNVLQDNDVVLVKGSHAVHLEKIVEKLEE